MSQTATSTVTGDAVISGHGKALPEEEIYSSLKRESVTL